MALRRLIKEQKDLKRYRADEPDCLVNAQPIEDDMFHWNGEIIGPHNTPYTNGHYTVDIVFPQDYPFKPPKVAFITKIYHPNITDQGKIICYILKDGWSPALTITKVLLSICSILGKPIYIEQYMNNNSEYIRSGNSNAIQLFINDRFSYQQKANDIAIQYAKATKYYTLKDVYIAIKSCLTNGFGGEHFAFILEPIIMTYSGFDIITLNKWCKQLKLDSDKRYERVLNEGYAEIIYSKYPSISIRCIWNRAVAVSPEYKIWNDYQIKDIKQLIHAKEGLYINAIMLLFKGNVLEHDKSIHEYNIIDQSVIDIVLKYY